MRCKEYPGIRILGSALHRGPKRAGGELWGEIFKIDSRMRHWYPPMTLVGDQPSDGRLGQLACPGEIAVDKLTGPNFQEFPGMPLTESSNFQEP